MLEFMPSAFRGQGYLGLLLCQHDESAIDLSLILQSSSKKTMI